MLFEKSLIILAIFPSEELLTSRTYFPTPRWDFLFAYITFFHKPLKIFSYKYELVKNLVLSLILKIVLFFSLISYKAPQDELFMEENNSPEPKWMSVLRNLTNPIPSEELNTSAIKSEEEKMVKALPTFKGYTVDERLKQFRKVDSKKPSIDFIEFDSEKGQELLEEYEESKE
jgi:hypothetical protein